MNTVANNTTLPTQLAILTTERPVWEATPSVTQTSMFFGLAAITVFGNALVIIAVYRDPYKELRTLSNYLVVNLAVADFFMGLVSETLWGLSLWVRSKLFYDVANATMFLSLVASCLTVLGMSVERYIVIKYGLVWRDILTPKRLKYFIAIVWLISLLMALLPTMGLRDYVTLVLIDTVGVPTLITMTVLYLLVFRILRQSAYRDIKRRSVDFRNQSSESQASLRSKLREKEVAKTICVVIVVFALCWLPTFISEHIALFCPDCLSQQINNFLNLFGLMNSFCNPIIYAFKMPKFRAAVKFLFCGNQNGTRKTGKRLTDSSTSSSNDKTVWYLKP